MRRYAKPIVVADDLALLRGRTTGLVTLPRHLDWSGSADYDLDSPGRIVDLYRTVLIEATKPDDLHAEQLLQLAEAADAGFDRAMFADTLGALGQISDAAFSPYGADAQAIQRLRQRFADWRNELSRP